MENAAGLCEKGRRSGLQHLYALPKENEKNLEWFLKGHPTFAAEDVSEFLPEGWDTETAKKGYLTLLPIKQEQTDFSFQN